MQRVGHMNAHAAKPVSFVSLETIIFSLRHPDEPSGEKEKGEKIVKSKHAQW